MATIAVTMEGRITLSEGVLHHLGVPPGGKIDVDLLPDGRVQLRAASGKCDWNELAGILDGKTNGARLSIDELNEAIAEEYVKAGVKGLTSE